MILLSHLYRSCAGLLMATLVIFPGSTLAASAGQASGMPSGLRKEAAFGLLSYFRQDAGEKPEISAFPKEITGSPTTYRLTIRYTAMVDGGIRCAYVESPSADAEGNFRFSLKKPAGSEPSCGSGEQLIRYRELETVITRIRACEKKGENRCVVSDPGTNNRRILVLH